MPKKKFYATRDFHDAGTEKAFTLGEDLTAEEGLSNYTAAGLASDRKPSTSDETTPAA